MTTIDGEPVVVLGALKVQDAGLGASDGAVRATVLDSDTIYDQTVDEAVTFQEGWCLRTTK